MAGPKNKLKNIFVAGFLVLLPIATTIFILKFLFNFLDSWLAPLGGDILRTLGLQVPEELKNIPGFGILATVVLVFLTGLIASNYLGKKSLELLDKFIKNIPLVNTVYTSLRQVVDSFSLTGNSAFKKVVMFQFPRPGIWVIGFLTTDAFPAAQKTAKQKLVNVFLPTTPNPTSGFFLMLPLKDIKVIDINPEEALKLIATVGIVQGNKKKISKVLTSKNNKNKKKEK